MQTTNSDFIDIMEKNHMEIPWHDYANDDSNVLIAEAGLIEKASVIGRVGLIMLSCGTGAWRVRTSMNRLSKELGVTCTVDVGLMSIVFNCFDGNDCISQSLSIANTGVNTSKLYRMEQFVDHFPEEEAHMTGEDIHKRLDEIEEKEGEFSIGCMCSLHQLETHEGLNRYFDGIFRECTRNIVGVQMRNCATVGGSIFARFGFSDILTCLLALDAYVELYHEGTIPLSEFAARPVRRDQKDILVRIIIKKDGRKAAYTSQRNSRTDFPVIACCVSNLGNKWFVSVGARPAKAKTVIITEDDFDTLKEMAKQAADAFTYGDNVRASGAYRKTLATVYIRRLMEQIKGRSVGRV